MPPGKGKDCKRSYSYISLNGRLVANGRLVKQTIFLLRAFVFPSYTILLTTLPTEKINKFVLLKTQFTWSYPTKRRRNVDVTVVDFVRIDQLVERGAS